MTAFGLPTTDYAPVEQRMMRFKGGQWELFGDIISAEARG
jgi:branched-chain amino acid transport system substrate-binding protein